MAKKKQRVLAPFLGRRKKSGKQRSKIIVSPETIELCRRDVSNKKDQQSESASSKKLAFFKDLKVLLDFKKSTVEDNHGSKSCLLLVQSSCIEKMISELLCPRNV